MLPSSETPRSGRSSNLKRYGPLAVIVVLAVVIAAVALTSGGKKSSSSSADSGGAGSSTRPADAVTYQQAKDEGRTGLTFPHCDTSTGRVAIPFYFSPECFADVSDNGGATSPGVTKDTITVVVYRPQENDPIIDYVSSAVKSTDTEEQTRATVQGYTDLFNTYYQTYGRKVVLTFMTASGVANDEVAARADAVKAATQYHAFAVWGGPALTSAFADELAARKVLCIGCTGGNPAYFEQRAPYLYSIASNQDQISVLGEEYIEKKLAGRKAVHAGDALKGEDRKFGLLYIESNADSKKSADSFESALKAKGIPLAARVAYTLDPARLQEQATSAIAKMKSAGVTTVVFSGDPVAPTTFTKEATAQDWFPEWVLGPSALVDVSAFGRTYDQQQWAHAFGPSAGSVRLAPDANAAYRLYQWFSGRTPPAATGYQLQFANPSFFISALQSAGPTLTPENFRRAVFSFPTQPTAITQPEITFGNHGFWPYTDYNGVDDETEIWWNPDATGPDEIGRQGKGLYEFVDGGKRYLPGQWPAGESRAFDPAGAVTILDQVPPSEAPPDYPSPAKGG